MRTVFVVMEQHPVHDDIGVLGVGQNFNEAVAIAQGTFAWHEVPYKNKRWQLDVGKVWIEEVQYGAGE